MHRRSAAFFCLLLLLMIVPVSVSATGSNTASLSSAEEDSGLCEHLWDDGVILREATCTRAGLLQRTCTLCGATQNETIPKLNHDWDEGTVI